MEPGADRYRRYQTAILDETLPLALVDLDALDRNVDAIVAPLRGTRKTLRIATKSLRCPDLVRYIARRGGPAIRGVMAFSPAEAGFLAQNGFDDVLIAYPTAQASGARIVAEANRTGAVVSLAVDCIEHLRVASAAAEAAGAKIPVIVDVDASYRPLGGRVHVGVRRSPLHDASEIADFVERIASFRHLVFAGLLAYEAHIAGIPDASPLAPRLDPVKRALKRLARAPVLALRRAIVDALERRGIRVPLFNGGGTGSVHWSVSDPSLTEVTAGSGFVDSHLFDHYDDLPLEPAACFALQITRRPSDDYVTCQGGGYVASGGAGPDRLPIPYLPEGLRLTDLEGAGEVQTPLLVPPGLRLEIGAPVFMRHAKAGELAEHFKGYLLVRGERVEARAETYRGAGECFA